MTAAGEARGISMTGFPTWEQAFHIVVPHACRAAPPPGKAARPAGLPGPRSDHRSRRIGTPWAERWELYVDGVEIANCYTEETDAAALRVAGSERGSTTKRLPHLAPYRPRLRRVVPPGLSDMQRSGARHGQAGDGVRGRKIARGGDLLSVFRYSGRTIRHRGVKGIT